MNIKLPEYDPSDEVWQHIEAKLNDDVLQKAIGQLPQYEPKEELWNQIEEQLKPKTKIIKFTAWQWVAVAASVAVLIGAFFIYLPDNQPISYSEEQIDKNLQLNPHDDSNKQYEQIVAYCKEQTYVCENPEFKSMKTELDELQNASYQLKDAMGTYNTDPELMTQFTEIEQQKTELLRKMAAKI